MLNSPFVQPLMNNANVKQQVDQLLQKSRIAPSDVKSITMGLAGLGAVNWQQLQVPGMGMPQNGPPRITPGSGTNLEKTHGVIVLRMSKPLPSDYSQTLKSFGYEEVSLQWKTYHRPKNVLTEPFMYIASSDVFIIGDEVEIVRIIQKGSQQVRRAEFDFIDPTPQIVVAMINKTGSSTSGAPGNPSARQIAPPGGFGIPMGQGDPQSQGSLGAPPGQPAAPQGADFASLNSDKVKAWAMGISFTQDIELQMSFHSPGAVPAIKGDLEKGFAKIKSEYETGKAAQQAMLTMMGMADLVPQLETALNSIQVSADDSTAIVKGKIPGAIKSTVEKAASTFGAMMGLGNNLNQPGGQTGMQPGMPTGMPIGMPTGMQPGMPPGTPPGMPPGGNLPGPGGSPLPTAPPTTPLGGPPRPN
jgi:hypothetical protein